MICNLKNFLRLRQTRTQTVTQTVTQTGRQTGTQTRTQTGTQMTATQTRTETGTQMTGRSWIRTRTSRSFPQESMTTEKNRSLAHFTPHSSQQLHR